MVSSIWSDGIPPRPKYRGGPASGGPWRYVDEQAGEWRTVSLWSFEEFPNSRPPHGYTVRTYLQRRRTSWLRRWCPWKTIRRLGSAEAIVCGLAELVERATQEPDHA